ncbi:hypothetical protein [Sinimarinibacterium sp. NLF-5-8]|uniref:hypothetical protein n=1 Tax=Sinimarinibacterium sp. NLF-5-8 TaxID=2698684 RepID=UPI00137BA45F|nr:hypothetical protein [Sinimarinibacterium sp. NLF-5-8]QHS09111.1 hypothetical protein GT972_02385 [Sinimarinibacterium sp. NLF-5-8]
MTENRDTIAVDPLPGTPLRVDLHPATSAACHTAQRPAGIQSDVRLDACRIALPCATYAVRSATDQGIVVERIGIGADRIQQMSVQRFKQWLGEARGRIVWVKKSVAYIAFRGHW